MTDWLKVARNAKTTKLANRALRKHEYELMIADISACTNCHLHINGQVPLDTVHPKPLVIVGDAPNMVDFKTGRNFSGRAGNALESMLWWKEIKRGDVAFLNRATCVSKRPTPVNSSNPKRTRESIRAACEENFNRQLDHTGALVVLEFCDADEQQEPRWEGGRMWVTALHPKLLVAAKGKEYNALMGPIYSRIRLAVDLAFYGAWLPSTIEDLTTDTSGRVMLGSMNATKALMDLGWVTTYLKDVDDRVVLVRDSEVVVPSKHATKVRYTLEEYVRLGIISKGSSPTNDEMQVIHLVKKTVLGSTVVK